MPIEPDPQKAKTKKRKLRWILFVFILIVLIVSFFYFFMRMKHVDTGFVAIKSSINSPIDNHSSPKIALIQGGYTIYMPLLTTISEYPTTIQSKSYKNITISSNDGVSFKINPIVSFQLNLDEIHTFHNNFSNNTNSFTNNYLKNLITESYASTALSFDSDSLIQNMSIFELSASTNLSAKLNKTGVILKSIIISTEIPNEIKSIVEQRNISKHNSLLAKDLFEEEYLKVNTQRVKDSLLNSALTELAIQKMFIDKWDGHLSVPVGEPQIYKDINSSKK